MRFSVMGKFSAGCRAPSHTRCTFPTPPGRKVPGYLSRISGIASVQCDAERYSTPASAPISPVVTVWNPPTTPHTLPS